MVRTKGDGAVTKVVGAKAPRKQLVSNTGASSSAYSQDDSNRKGRVSSGLPYCPQPTPEWQKSVKSFFTFKPTQKSSQESDGENKENEKREVVSNEEDDIKQSRSKGKQPQKRSRKGTGSKTKKSSKSKKSSEEGAHSESEEVKESDSETAAAEKTADEKKESIDKLDNDNVDDNAEEEPVKRKRNRIIESDEDE